MCLLLCCDTFRISKIRLERYATSEVGAEREDSLAPPETQKMKENGYEPCVRVCSYPLWCIGGMASKSPHLLIMKLEQTGFARECEGS